VIYRTAILSGASISNRISPRRIEFLFYSTILVKCILILDYIIEADRRVNSLGYLL
jgi:hypothetical protein